MNTRKLCDVKETINACPLCRGQPKFQTKKEMITHLTNKHPCPINIVHDPLKYPIYKDINEIKEHDVQVGEVFCRSLYNDDYILLCSRPCKPLDNLFFYIYEHDLRISQVDGIIHHYKIAFNCHKFNCAFVQFRGYPWKINKKI